MYRLIVKNKPIGDYEKVVFTKVNPNSGCYVQCTRNEAEGVVVGGTVYALTDAKGYEDCEQAAIIELDGTVEMSAKIDYMKIMYGNNV